MDPIVIEIQKNLGSAPTDIGVFFSNAVGVALLVAAVAAFIYLVFGGLQWITAGGDKGKIEQARDRITGAIIGLMIVAVSWSIFLLVDHFFGLGMANSRTGGGGGGGGGTGTCIYPTRRCCDNVSDSTCFCQNTTYRAISYGSCDAGGGQTGVRCGCVPR